MKTMKDGNMEMMKTIENDGKWWSDGNDGNDKNGEKWWKIVKIFENGENLFKPVGNDENYEINCLYMMENDGKWWRMMENDGKRW